MPVNLVDQKRLAEAIIDFVAVPAVSRYLGIDEAMVRLRRGVASALERLETSKEVIGAGMGRTLRSVYNILDGDQADSPLPSLCRALRVPRGQMPRVSDGDGVRRVAAQGTGYPSETGALGAVP
jgi:hypothetical protein